MRAGSRLVSSEKIQRAGSSQQKRRIGDSAAISLAALKLRTSPPRALKGFGPGRYKVLGARERDDLRIDDAGYQRMNATSDVNELALALLAGGEIPAPIIVSERPDGSRWVMDGQRRYAACVLADKPVPAMIHTPEGRTLADIIAVERAAFIILNIKREVKGNYIVRAHPGEITDIIKKAAGSPGHPLCGLIAMDQSSPKIILEASVAVRAIHTLLSPRTGHVGGGRVGQQLMNCDEFLKRPGARARAEALLNLIGLVFVGNERCQSPVAVTFAMVAKEKWALHIAMPSEKDTARLRAVQWSKTVPTWEARMRPLAAAEITKRWRT